MGMNTLHRDGYPRHGRYELFIHYGRVYCHDDPSFVAIQESQELHNWVRQQPTNLWKGMDPPYDKTVYYLQPSLYAWFLLRWAHEVC